MSDNLENITLPINEWVDLYQLSGIEVGTALSIENIGVCDVYLAVQAIQPEVDHDSYDIINRANGVRLQNTEGDPGAWAFCNSKGGKLAVQPLAETGFYPHSDVNIKTHGGDKVGVNNPLPIQNIDYIGRNSLNTCFGDSITGVRTADIAAQFQYGFPASSATPDTENGGTVSINESMLVVSTGVDPAGFAAISNRKALRYLPGEEAFTGFTSVFTTPQPDSEQWSGIFDGINGFRVGYDGIDFKIVRTRDGVDYIQTVDLASVYELYDGVFDPTKGNVYRITFGYYGFAPATFEVLTPSGTHALLGQIKYPNSEEVTHILNTNLQPRIEVKNTGNTSDMTVKVGSFSAGVINGGGADPAARRITFARSNQAIVAGTQTVITFRSKSTFAGITNYIQSVFTLLSFNTDLSKSSLWELEKNADITNTPTWTDLNTLDSTIEYSGDAVVSIGTGVDTFPLPLGRVDRELLDNIEKEMLEMLPGDYFTLFITTPGGTNGTFDYSFRIKELF